MSSRLDYAKAKRRRPVSPARADDDSLPRRDSLKGWRTSWPEEFPVTVTRLPVTDPSSEAVDGVTETRYGDGVSSTGSVAA